MFVSYYAISISGQLVQEKLDGLERPGRPPSTGAGHTYSPGGAALRLDRRLATKDIPNALQARGMLRRVALVLPRRVPYLYFYEKIYIFRRGAGGGGTIRLFVLPMDFIYGFLVINLSFDRAVLFVRSHGLLKWMTYT